MVARSHKMKNKVIILEDSSFSDYGGGQNVTLQIMKYISKDTDIINIDFTKKSKYLDLAKNYVKKIYTLPFSLKRCADSSEASTKLSLFSLLMYVPGALINLIYLFFIVLSNKNTKITCYSATRHTHLYCCLLRLLPGIKTIAHVHSHEPQNTIKYKINNILLSLFNRVIFVSHFQKSKYKNINAYVLYNPITNKDKIISNFDIYTNDPIQIAFVGKLLQWKGIYVFVDATQKLSHLYESKSIIFSVFGDGPILSSLREKHLNVPIVFHGYQDTDHIFKNVDVIVAPSIDSESCPMVILESISNNKLFITSDLGGQKELATIFGGIIVKNNCSQSLATCIEDVCSMKNYSYKNIQRLNDINDYIKTIKKILY